MEPTEQDEATARDKAASIRDALGLNANEEKFISTIIAAALQAQRERDAKVALGFRSHPADRDRPEGPWVATPHTKVCEAIAAAIRAGETR